MNHLINTIIKMEEIIKKIENILNQENHYLLNTHKNVDELKYIFKKKSILFEKFSTLNKNRLSIEHKYNIFPPYKHNTFLEQSWCNIVYKCMFLKKINLHNKILINKHVHLNQQILEFFSPYKTSVVYDINGNLKN